MKESYLIVLLTEKEKHLPDEKLTHNITSRYHISENTYAPVEDNFWCNKLLKLFILARMEVLVRYLEAYAVMTTTPVTMASKNFIYILPSNFTIVYIVDLFSMLVLCFRTC